MEVTYKIQASTSSPLQQVERAKCIMSLFSLEHLQNALAGICQQMLQTIIAYYNMR